MIKFSVIVPNYNHAEFLKQRLDSILQQTYPFFELIILDDCSSDNSREIIESYRHHPKVSQILYNTKNSGSPFRQWTKGINVADADWVWIAESDDFSENTFLEQAEISIRNSPFLGIYYCDCFIVDARVDKFVEKFSERKNRIFKTLKWSTSYSNEGIAEINECLKFDCTINNTSSAVFNKTLVKHFLDDLDEFVYYGDWYFFLKASLITNIYYQNIPLNFHRRHSSSHTTNSFVSMVITRHEYFRILKLLCSNERVKEKNRVINHFALYYLGFGIIEHGLNTSYQILKRYFRTDKTLALRVYVKLFLIKLIRKKANGIPPKRLVSTQ